MKEIVLASASKRRSEILASCGIPHRVVPSGARESMSSGRHVPGVVLENAETKAKTVSEKEKNSVVIGADTLVVHNGEMIGKPREESAARGMLKRFSGDELEVYTGLCVIDAPSGKKASGFAKSSLSVAVLNDEQVERYFRMLGPYDKAGGFSIEGVGAMLFDDIRGSYFNILGLPMITLRELFCEIELDILDYIRR